jgi:hypothetical protein
MQEGSKKERQASKYDGILRKTFNMALAKLIRYIKGDACRIDFFFTLTLTFLPGKLAENSTFTIALKLVSVDTQCFDSQ